MDIKRATEILELELKTDLNPATVKKQYHKLALLYHPDKNNGSIEANKRFQEINEAYKYLLPIVTDNNTNNTNNYTNNDTNNTSTNENIHIYTNLLSTFVSSIINNNKEFLIKIIKDVVINGSKKIIEDLDKETLLELYSFLCKYKNILFVSLETIELIKNSVKNKFENNEIIILNPSIDDLFENNVYKLHINNEVYLVPLWHNELYFDAEDGSEIIVLCQPKLPTNITIDENNNIYCEICINICNELPYLLKNSKFVSLSIGEKWFSIPLDKLFIKEEQLYKFKGQGIAHISEKDIYNVSSKADIIVKIILV